MEFDNTSHEIWEEMQAGTPFSGPKRDEGDYTADFFGTTIGELVDYLALDDFLYETQYYSPNQVFNYEDFVLHPSKLAAELKGAFQKGEMLSFKGNAWITYKDQFNKKKTSSFLIKLNKRIDRISPSLSSLIRIDPSGTIYADIKVYYAGTESERTLNTATSDPDDFNINPKYIAANLVTHDLEDYMQLCTRLLLPHHVEDVKEVITDKYLAHLKRHHPAHAVESLYAKMPHYIMEGIAQKVDKLLLVKHLYMLKASDDSNWFTDTSGAILVILRLLCAGNIAFLYQLFVRHQTLVKALYYNMHGESVIDGQTYPNRYLFVQLLSTVCSFNGFKGLVNTGHKYYVGKGFQPDSNVDETHDPATDLIFLKQYKTVYNQITPLERFYRVPLNDKVEDQKAITNGQYYHPLTIVKLYDLNQKDALPMLVPALFVKYFSDAEEWQDIMRNVRIGLDMLGIILGVLSLGTSSGLLFALAVADIGISSADALLMLNDDLFKNSKEGREFLAAWDKVVAYGSIATAGPLLLKGVFTKGVTALRAPQNEVTREFIKKNLATLIKEINPYRSFIQQSFQMIDKVEDLMKASNYAFKKSYLTNLMNADVVFLVKTEQGAQTANKEFAVVYEGQIIAEGNARSVKEQLKELDGLKGEKLVKKLEAFVKFSSSGTGGYFKYKKIISRKMLKQEEPKSCAAACIRQLADDEGIHLSEKEIRELSRTTEFGTSNKGIELAMESIFKEKTVLALTFSNNPDKIFPTIAKDLSKKGKWIATIHPQGGRRHAIIVDKIVGKDVYIRDPWPLEGIASGKHGVVATVDLDDFAYSWIRGQAASFQLK